jgi:lipid kinase YegS
MNRHCRIILNGKFMDSLEFRETVYAMRKLSFEIDVRVTWEHGDAARFVHEALNDRVNRIISAGGDGTLHETVNAMISEHEKTGVAIPSLGIIPLGTANDFAKSANLPLSVPEAVNFAISGTAIPADIIRIEKWYFLNVATSGFGATVTASTPVELKRFLGGASYALMGLILSINLEAHEGEMSLPGQANRKGSILVGAVGNGRQAGGGIPLTPQAFIDDGLMDILYIRQFPVTDLGTVIQELAELPEDGQYVSYVQTPWAEFGHKEAIHINLDGEPYMFKDGRAEVIRHAINIVIPDDCPLLLKNRASATHTDTDGI